MRALERRAIYYYVRFSLTLIELRRFKRGDLIRRIGGLLHPTDSQYPRLLIHANDLCRALGMQLDRLEPVMHSQPQALHFQG